MVDAVRTGRALGMDDAAAGRHPVDLAGADRNRGAERIAMHDLAVEQIADGGEPDMGMRPHVEAIAVAEFSRSEMVEENEWSDHARTRRRQRPAYREAVAEVHRPRRDHIGERVAGVGVARRRVGAGKEAHAVLQCRVGVVRQSGRSARPAQLRVRWSGPPLPSTNRREPAGEREGRQWVPIGLLSLTPPLRGHGFIGRWAHGDAGSGIRMGRFVRALTRRNLIAIAAGVVLAGVPLLAFNLWIGSLVDGQGQREITNAAMRAVSVANARLSQALTALDDLAAQGVSSCGGDALEKNEGSCLPGASSEADRHPRAGRPCALQRCRAAARPGDVARYASGAVEARRLARFRARERTGDDAAAAPPGRFGAEPTRGAGAAVAAAAASVDGWGTVAGLCRHRRRRRRAARRHRRAPRGSRRPDPHREGQFERLRL